MPQPGKSARPANLLLAIASTVAAVVFTGTALWYLRPEIIWRMTGKEPTPARSYRVPHPIYHHALLPNTRAYTINKETRRELIEFTTNSLGLRDPERAIPKPHGIFRILMLGDSFIEGGSVAREATVCAVLEKTLGGKSGVPIEVVNAGSASYSPLVEYLFLKHNCLRLEPDLVVLNLDMSDIQDDLYYEEQAEFDGSGTPVGVAAKYDLTDWTNRKAFELGDIRTDRFFHTRDGMTLTPLLESRFDRTWDYIVMTERLARSRGAGFLLVTYPMGHQVNGTEWGKGRAKWFFDRKTYTGPIFDYLERRSRLAGIAFLNLLPGFRESRIHPLFFDHDGHWTPEGHRLAAEIIGRFLVENRFPPFRSPSR